MKVFRTYVKITQWCCLRPSIVIVHMYLSTYCDRINWLIRSGINLFIHPFIVSGEANFDMKLTGFTLGEFIQPSISRNLLEQGANVEKGLCQRFLWFVPKPTPVPFDQLQKVDRDFSVSIGKGICDLNLSIYSNAHYS